MNMKNLAAVLKWQNKVMYDIVDDKLYVCANYLGVILENYSELPNALKGIAIPGNGEAYTNLTKLLDDTKLGADCVSCTGIYWQRTPKTAPMMILEAQKEDHSYPIFVDARFMDVFSADIILETAKGEQSPLCLFCTNYVAFVMPVIVEKKDRQAIVNQVSNLFGSEDVEKES